MKMSKFLAAMLLVVAAPAMSAPIVSTFDLGTLGVPAAKAFGNTFNKAGLFEDRYTFTITEQAHAGSIVLELSPILLDVTQIALSGVGKFAGPTLLGLYDFGSLSAGDYTLSIFSKSSTFLKIPVSYGGILGLKSTGSTPVPAPGTLALLGLGLLGVAFAARRRSVSTN